MMENRTTMSNQQPERTEPALRPAHQVPPGGRTGSDNSAELDRGVPSAGASRSAGGLSTGAGPGDDVLRRTPRRTREELRRLLVEAGAEILWDEGLAAGAEHLTFKRVFEHLEKTSGVRITHASVIGRIWPNQEQFQTDVLTRVAALDIPDVDAEVEEALSSLGELDRSTPEARLRAATEICRVGGEATFHTIVQSRMWPRWMGIWALAVVDPGSPRKKPIADALLHAEMDATDYYEERYTVSMQVLGLRIREPFTVRQFALAIDAFAQGCALRAGVDPTVSHMIDRPTGPEGGEQPWTLFAVGLEAMVRSFVEIDPDWTDT
jgi:hypothetical protein